MSLRSRNFLAGVGTGFFRANNERRSKMEERLSKLTNDTATRDREQAKSRYTADLAASSAEAKSIQSMKTSGHLTEDLEYTPLYWEDAAREEWLSTKNKTKDSLEVYAQKYSQGRGKRMVRQYKDPSAITARVNETYQAIDRKQKSGLSAPVRTGFDELLGRGIVKGYNAVGDAVENLGSAAGLDVEVEDIGLSQPSAPIDIPQADSMAAPSGPVETIAKTDEQTNVEIRTLDKIVTIDGKMKAFFLTDDGPEGTKKEIDLGTVTSRGDVANRQTTESFIMNRATGKFTGEPTQVDKNTGEMLIEGQWVKPSSDIAVVPSAQITKIQEYKYTDEYGVEMAVQGYLTSPDTADTNVIVRPDGLTVSPTGTPYRVRGEIDDTNKGAARPKVVNDRQGQYSRDLRVAKLANKMVGQKYVSNLTDFVYDHLATIGDAVVGNFSSTGNRESDIDAIIEFINNDLKGQDEMRDLIGTMDTAAVMRGSNEVIQNMLTYAVAKQLNDTGKLNVNTIATARDLATSFFVGNAGHAGKMAALIEQSEESMKHIVGQDIQMARLNPSSKIWDIYPFAKQATTLGFDLVSSKSEGDILVKRINLLKEGNPEAYSNTIANLRRVHGTEDSEVLMDAMRFDRYDDSLKTTYYIKKEDGSIDFTILPLK